MPNPGTPTLDQLKVFLTVVDVGSFAGAARKLSRATSVISYTIANLENQLGVALFDRKTTKKPQLTEAGRTVLAEARTVYLGIDGLRAKVKGLLQGLEAELHLVVDVMLPAARVVDALKAFRDAFPTVALHLHMEALGAVGAAGAGPWCPRLASAGRSAQSRQGSSASGSGGVMLRPVAAPGPPPGPAPTLIRQAPDGTTCNLCCRTAPRSRVTWTSR
ncbi:LysR family transcriptional regulator [Cupriavidus basilensis]